MSTKASRVIAALVEAFADDRIALPNTEIYNERQVSYLSLLESEIQPTAIFLPKTKDEVSSFVRIISAFVEQHDARFAIRGAGQQPLPGCANIEHGVTLDLSQLTGIELGDSMVSIGAGERWGPVYDRLHEEGLGVTGARSGNNGIGGLALAGGLSFFGTREGFICDNVLNYEVVLASGEIVNANKDSNPDLFLALRGSGNNLGIVTRFDLRTFKQGPFWGGAVFYFPDSFRGQIKALVEELQKPEADEETHIMISLFFAAQFGAVMGLNQAYYTKEVESPPVLEPFTAMQPQLADYSKMRMVTLKEAAAEQAAMAMTGVRCAYMNTTVKADEETLQAASEIFSKALEHVKSFEGIVCSFTLQPYPLSLLKKTAPAGGNSLGLDPTDALVSVLLLMYWKSSGDDDTILSTAKSVIEEIDADAIQRGKAVPYKYLDYAWAFQDPIGSYGSESVEKLKGASKKYDPKGLFQRGVPGGFKLLV